jgi:ubiquinone/menaquinone biosynthesis C-methylase UbiE
MKLWNIKAAAYFWTRRLSFFRCVLDNELANLRFLIQSIPEPYPFVIDLGTGAGSTLEIFPVHIPIIGLDRSFSMLKNAAKNRDGLSGLVGSAEHLPFRNDCVSIISAIGITEYLRDKETLINEIKRILKNEGYVLITISQPSFLNRLRNLLGNRIYPIDPECWKRMLCSAGWICVSEKGTLIQKQYLYRI